MLLRQISRKSLGACRVLLVSIRSMLKAHSSGRKTKFFLPARVLNRPFVSLITAANYCRCSLTICAVDGALFTGSCSLSHRHAALTLVLAKLLCLIARSFSSGSTHAALIDCACVLRIYDPTSRPTGTTAPVLAAASALKIALVRAARRLHSAFLPLPLRCVALRWLPRRNLRRRLRACVSFSASR